MSIEDALSQLVNEGYNISLDGPDVSKIMAEYRWSLRVYTNRRDSFDHPIGREIFHGDSALAVLQQGVAWIDRRGRGEQP